MLNKPKNLAQVNFNLKKASNLLKSFFNKKLVDSLEILKRTNDNKLKAKRLKRLFVNKNKNDTVDKDKILSKYLARFALKDRNEILKEFLKKVEKIKLV